MNKENGVVYLTSIVALAIILMSAVAGYYQSLVVVPLVILGIIFFILILLTNKGNIAHKIESLENICFIITFLVIVVTFIVVYKPI